MVDCSFARNRNRTGKEMKRRMRNSSLVWAALGSFICVESFYMPLGSWRDPGPGFLCLGSGISLTILSLICYVQSWTVDQEPVPLPLPRPRSRNLVYAVAALVIYTACLEILGFRVATFLLLLFLFRCIEPQKWGVAVGGSALTTGISYALFEMWLKTPLPKGLMGF